MSVADKIGLLPGLGWLTGHGFIVTLAICWLVSPVSLWAVRLIVERRRISLKQEDNFVSFFPGDLFLGFSAACLLMLARDLPTGQHWYNNLWWHIAVLVSCIIGGLCVTRMEYRRGQYTLGQIFTPTKLWHDVGYYDLYGYPIAATFIAVVSTGTLFAHWYYTLGAAASFLVWSFLAWFDQNALSDTQRFLKSADAHRSDWYNNWRRKPAAQVEPELPMGLLGTFNPPRGDDQTD